MTSIIKVYPEGRNAANIAQLPVKRQWMDETPNKHAYQCMPLSLANSLGWGISFPEDISFIWDGICDTTADHVKIISGNKYCFTSRGNATISFNTHLTVVTEENVTTLVMPVPNEFNENAQCFTNFISTSISSLVSGMETVLFSIAIITLFDLNPSLYSLLYLLKFLYQPNGGTDKGESLNNIRSHHNLQQL